MVPPAQLSPAATVVSLLVIAAILGGTLFAVARSHGKRLERWRAFAAGHGLKIAEEREVTRLAFRIEGSLGELALRCRTEQHREQLGQPRTSSTRVELLFPRRLGLGILLADGSMRRALAVRPELGLGILRTLFQDAELPPFGDREASTGDAETDRAVYARASDPEALAPRLGAQGRAAAVAFLAGRPKGFVADSGCYFYSNRFLDDLDAVVPRMVEVCAHLGGTSA